jgi:NAD+ diphosphatase
MAAPLSPAQEHELEGLSHQYGRPLYVEAEIFPGFDDPVHKTDRVGEVCMVIRRPNGKLLLSIKTMYPRGAYRLPTGGVKRGEPVIAALFREAHEETGLSVRLRRFLALISYRPQGGTAPIFHTFAFLLEETGGTLGALDPDEKIEAYVEVDPAELTGVADRLDGLEAAGRGSVGSWRDWGRFRAIVHRAVHEALSSQA